MKLVVYNWDQTQSFCTVEALKKLHPTALKNFSYLSVPEIVEALPRLPRSELQKLFFISDNQLKEINFASLDKAYIDSIFMINNQSIVETRRRLQVLSPKKLAEVNPKLSPFLQSLTSDIWKNVSDENLANLFYISNLEISPHRVNFHFDDREVYDRKKAYDKLTPEQQELIKPHFSEKTLKALNLQ